MADARRDANRSTTEGIWVGRVGDVSGQTCQLTKTLVIPGGSSPDWGPAKP